MASKEAVHREEPKDIWSSFPVLAALKDFVKKKGFATIILALNLNGQCLAKQI